MTGAQDAAQTCRSSFAALRLNSKPTETLEEDQ